MSKITIAKEEFKAKMLNQFTDLGTSNIVETTELGDSLKELNNDDRDPSTKMTGIDLRTRLAFTEVSAILAVDTLVAFNFIPKNCLIFTRQKKRLCVSLAGKGRQEIVDIVAGKKEHDLKKGFFGNLLGKKEVT